MTEVTYSTVRNGSETSLFDPEYFQRVHLDDELTIKNNPHKFVAFSDMGIKVDASAFYPSIEPFYGTGNLPFLRVADVDKVIDFESCTKIPEELTERYPTLSTVDKGDIVLTKGGSVARAGLVTKKAAVSRDLIFLNSSSLSEFSSKALSTYFQTDFFRRLMLRSSSQTAQPHLTITLIRNLPALKMSTDFESLISHLVDEANSVRSDSIRLQQQAESLLLSELGLEHWQPPEALTYERSTKDVFGAQRLDAEYYHPAKSAALAHLEKIESRSLGELFSSVRDLWNPQGDPKQYVQNYDLTAALSPFLDPHQPLTEASEIGSTKKAFQQGDLVVSRLRSYLREIATVTHSAEVPMVGSSEFIVLRPKSQEFSSDALGLYLRSLLPQIVLKWSQDGANHPRFNQDELLNIPVPLKVLAMNSTLSGIALNIQECHVKSTRLLDAAKRAVEIAIEESEAAALAYLNEQTAPQTTN